MEQANLFTEEAPVHVIEKSLNCRRCGRKTKKMTIADGYLHRLYVLCGRCKRMDEEGEAKMPRGDMALAKSKGPIPFSFPPITNISPERAVICRTKEELHIVNQHGLVGVLHPAFSL